MTQRITDRHLDAACKRLNTAAGTPLTYMNDEREIQPGHYHVHQAYGGCQLVQTINNGGGVRTIIYGYVTKRETLRIIEASIAGVLAGQASCA